MAEAVGLVASIIAIVQITEEVIKISKKYIHTEQETRSVLAKFIGKLSAYEGLFKGLELQARYDESNSIRLSSLEHINGPLDACKEALRVIEKKLRNPPSPLNISFGKILPREAVDAIKRLDDLQPLLQFALEADQRYDKSNAVLESNSPRSES